MTQLTKRKSLAIAIGLLMASLLGIGLGIALLFNMLGINSVLAGTIASQFAVLIYALSLFDFNFKWIKPILKKKVSFKLITLAVMATGFAVGVNYILEILTSNIVENTETTAQLLVKEGVMLSFVLPVIVAPFVEELAFRGGLKRILVDNGNWSCLSYVIMSSMLFGLLHFGPGVLGLTHIILTTIMGLIYSIIYIKTDNIYVSILSHMMYNGIIVTLTSLLV